MIAVCSLFRDNADDIERCFEDRSKWQVDHDQLLHVCLEGDSTDGTYDALCAMKSKHKVVVHQHHSGHPRYPSIITAERMMVLGRASNIALEIAHAERPTHIMWLDSDVHTQPDLVPRLIGEKRDVIAPMFYFKNSIFFRDTWGYRSKTGEFTNRPMYCQEYDRRKPFEVTSVGLPLIDIKVVDAGARFTETEEIVGFCNSVRDLGFKIYCHPHVYVDHPRMGIEIPKVYERNAKR